MIKISLVALVLVFAAAFTIQVTLCQTDGGQTDGGLGASLDVPPPTPSTSSGGGGGRKTIDFDKILKALQEGKKKKPGKFEEMKKLLYIEPFSTIPYSTEMSMGLSVSGNKTITRNDKFDVVATIVNPNPIEIRRVLYIYLEALEPGDGSFKRVNPVAHIIQINDYDEDSDGKNVTARAFPDLTSFSHLKDVGAAVLRLQVSDGQYNWCSKNLTLNVTNQPPRLENITIVSQPNPRYNDPIEYKADIVDPDGDMLNVTLHILDQQGMIEIKNETQEINGGGVVSFKANEYGLFSEADASKNFTYYYSFDDGINFSRIETQVGPSIRRGPKLFVDKTDLIAESENYYWWQWYTFNVRAKNLNPEEFDVTFTLYTDTKNNPGKVIESKTVRIGPESQVISFNKTKPFVVTDANESFSYKIKFSEYDQNGREALDHDNPRYSANPGPDHGRSGGSRARDHRQGPGRRPDLPGLPAPGAGRLSRPGTGPPGTVAGHEYPPGGAARSRPL